MKFKRLKTGKEKFFDFSPKIYFYFFLLLLFFIISGFISIIPELIPIVLLLMIFSLWKTLSAEKKLQKKILEIFWEIEKFDYKNSDILAHHQQKEKIRKILFLHNLLSIKNQEIKNTYNNVLKIQKKGEKFYQNRKLNIEERIYKGAYEIEIFEYKGKESHSLDFFFADQQKKLGKESHKIGNILMLLIIFIAIIGFTFLEWKSNLIIGFMCIIAILMGFQKYKAKYSKTIREPIYVQIMFVSSKKFFITKGQIDYLSQKIQEFFSEIQKTEEIRPEISLAFADIIEIFSEKISEKQKLLQKYKKSWIRISRPFFIFPAKIPVNIQEFFKKEEQRIVDEIIFAKKCINDFSQIEAEKIQKISDYNNSKFENLKLSGKRQEILIENLKKLQKA